MIRAILRRIPVVKINGNYTAQGFEKDFAAKRLWRGKFWRLFTLILTKSDERAARYIAARVQKARVKNLGELKFELPVHDDLKTAGEALRVQINRQVLTIASSVEAEEEALLETLAQMKSELAQMPLVIWAPRSPQRFENISENARKKG